MKNFNNFNYPIFKNIKQLSKNYNPYLIIISVPTKKHFTVFLDVIKYLNPKIILFEKPFGKNLSEAKKIVELCKKKKIHLFVNYIRNYLPNIYKLKKLTYGKKSLVTINYSGNLLNDFCHYFYFLDYLFGLKSKPNSKKIFNMFKNCIIKLNKVKKNQKDSLRIKSKNLSIDWKNNNIVRVKKSFKKVNLNVDLDNYQYHVLDNISQNIFLGKKNVLITGKKALKFHNIFNGKQN